MRRRKDGTSSRAKIPFFTVFMKTYKHLWEQFITKENFELAYYNSIKGKGRQKSVQDFKENWEENLEEVRQMVIRGEFHTSPYKEKVIFEPKKRTIYMLPYNPDRIVQHAIMNILKPILMQKMIQNSFSCVEGRGQIKASLKCSEYVRKFDWCLKCDIHKFYPSISQEILSNKLHRIIADKKFMAVVDDVIFSFPGGYNCPIGNYLSQWFGNYYLSFLDNYVLHELKPGGYERYCDDFILFDNDKAKLQECRKKIDEFIWYELELEYSKAELFKTKTQGVDFCGYRHFKNYSLLRKRTGKKLKARYNSIYKELLSGCEVTEKMRGQVASGHGLLKHACTYHLRQAIEHDSLMFLMNIIPRHKKKKKEMMKHERVRISETGRTGHPGHHDAGVRADRPVAAV